MNFLSIFEGIGIGWSCMVEETIVLRENHQSRIVNHYSAGNQTWAGNRSGDECLCANQTPKYKQ